MVKEHYTVRDTHTRTRVYSHKSQIHWRRNRLLNWIQTLSSTRVHSSGAWLNKYLSFLQCCTRMLGKIRTLELQSVWHQCVLLLCDPAAADPAGLLSSETDAASGDGRLISPQHQDHLLNWSFYWCRFVSHMKHFPLQIHFVSPHLWNMLPYIYVFLWILLIFPVQTVR